MKKAIALLMLAAAGLTSQMAQAKPSGVSVYGEEAREVYNALIAAGATRVDTEQGPEVIFEKVDCLDRGAAADCAFKGDPRLSNAGGAAATRLIKALVGVGVKTKAVDGSTQSINLNDLNCGILHYPDQGNSLQDVHTNEMPSCYLVDNNS